MMLVVNTVLTTVLTTGLVCGAVVWYPQICKKQNWWLDHSWQKDGWGCPFIITSHARKVLERSLKKNPHGTPGDIKEQVPEVTAVSLKHIIQLIKETLKILSRSAAQSLSWHSKWRGGGQIINFCIEGAFFTLESNVNWVFCYLILSTT